MADLAPWPAAWSAGRSKQTTIHRALVVAGAHRAERSPGSRRIEPLDDQFANHADELGMFADRAGANHVDPKFF